MLLSRRTKYSKLCLETLIDKYIPNRMEKFKSSYEKRIKLKWVYQQESKKANDTGWRTIEIITYIKQLIEKIIYF